MAFFLLYTDDRVRKKAFFVAPSPFSPSPDDDYAIHLLVVTIGLKEKRKGQQKMSEGGNFPDRRLVFLLPFPLFSCSGGNERNDVAARMYWKWESLLRNHNFLPHGNIKIIYAVIFYLSSGQAPLPAPAAPPATRIVEISVSAAAAA